MTDPAVGRDPVEQLAEEFMARLRRGERPALSEYVAAGDWRLLHRHYDTTVLIDVPEEELRRRLTERWKELDPQAFAFKMEENDIPNGRLVRTGSITPEFTVLQGVGNEKGHPDQDGLFACEI